MVAACIFKADPLGITSNHTHEDSLIPKAEAPHHLPFPPPSSPPWPGYEHLPVGPGGDQQVGTFSDGLLLP